MTTITLDPVLLAYLCGLGLLAFSIFRPGILVFLAIIAAMFGVIVAGDQGTVGGWVQVSAGLVMLWSVLRIVRGVFTS
jgi:hypothetical protein